MCIVKGLLVQINYTVTPLISSKKEKNMKVVKLVIAEILKIDAPNILMLK